MDEKPIEYIICAVRGRPQSRDTATQAIDMALKHNARLTFVLIIDAEFLAMATPAMTRLRTVLNQLEEMSEFALLILTDRAHRRGVQEVDSFVLKGAVREELRKLAASTEAQVMIIGRPDPNVRSSVFQPDEFETFITELNAHTGLEIIPVDSDLPYSEKGI